MFTTRASLQHRAPSLGRRRSLVAFALVCGALVTGLPGCGSTSEEIATERSPKEKVRALLMSLETGDTSTAAYIDGSSYKQHNLRFADGLAGFGAFLSTLPKGSVHVKIARVFQDGDYVFSHADYVLGGKMIGFDVFRFSNGKIVEHWDNLQDKVEATSPGGHTMTDGPTEPIDLEKTAANKALVRSFVEEVLLKGQFSKLGDYFDGDRYIQHDPAVADGVSGLKAMMEKSAAAGKPMKLVTLHKVLGEGNFVLTLSEGLVGSTPTAFYDLFRVENGKIAEHWDTIETIPPRAEWKNENGKF